MTNTVRVRIAVAVNDCSQWEACGGTTRGDLECRGLVANRIHEEGATAMHIRFIEADVDIPTSPTVEGSVRDE